MQSYLSAINGFYRDHGAEPVAQGDFISKRNVRNYLARHYFHDADEGKDAQADPRPAPTSGGKPIASSVQCNKVVALPLAGTAASPKIHGLVGMLKQPLKRAGGFIKHNTNAVKNLAAMQAFPGDNVDEGSSSEPPAKKAKPPAAKPAGGVPARGRGGVGARAGGGVFGSRAGRQAAPWQR
eukprot:jgi/Tetstr1/427511/TSEL_017637.t1